MSQVSVFASYRIVWLHLLLKHPLRLLATSSTPPSTLPPHFPIPPRRHLMRRVPHWDVLRLHWWVYSPIMLGHVGGRWWRLLDQDWCMFTLHNYESHMITVHMQLLRKTCPSLPAGASVCTSCVNGSYSESTGVSILACVYLYLWCVCLSLVSLRRLVFASIIEVLLCLLISTNISH